MSDQDPSGEPRLPALEPPPWSEEERPLLPFLPVIYIAWADGELTAEEIAEISAMVDAHPSLDRRSCSRLMRWLDPGSPPSARELQAMLRTVRQAARNLEDPQRATLADLGHALADLSRAHADSAGAEDGGAGERVAAAVRELESALALSGVEAARQILWAQLPRPRPGAQAAAPPPFDVAAMTRVLDGRYGEVRARVRELLSSPELAYVYGLPSAEYREHVLSWCRRLADEGLGAVSYPREVGGGGDLGAFVAVFETLAFHDQSLVVKFGVQFGLFGGSVHQLGTERHHRTYLPDIGSLELPGCFAMSETGHGSNVRDIETVAAFDRATDEFVIHTPHPLARKDWIGNAAAHGRMATVFAQLEIDGESQGVHAFLVPIRDRAGIALAGVSIEDCGLKVGLNGVDNGRLSFDRVRIPRENLLNRFADVDEDGVYTSPIPGASRRFFTMLGTLVGGRVSVACASLSAAKTALAVAIGYGARRRQFGPAGEAEVVILDYLSHQRRLMPRLATAYALDFGLKHLMDRYLVRTEEDSREVETLAAGLKAMASWFSIETLQTCREACGGQGYLTHNRLGPLRADVDIFTTFEGDNTVLLQLVAKGALTDYRRQFGSLNVGTVMKYLAHRTAREITALNPVAGRRTGPEHLRDPDFQLAAFRFREESLIASAARRLKRRIDDGLDSFVAFNQVQDHLLAMAKAVIERVVLQRFNLGIEAVEDEEIKAALAPLRDLYALSHMEKAIGWFQETGYVESPQAKAIRAEVNALCGEVRKNALPLVNAFGIPDQLLAAPIAFGEGTERV